MRNAFLCACSACHQSCHRLAAAAQGVCGRRPCDEGEKPRSRVKKAQKKQVVTASVWCGADVLTSDHRPHFFGQVWLLWQTPRVSPDSPHTAVCTDDSEPFPISRTPNMPCGRTPKTNDCTHDPWTLSFGHTDIIHHSHLSLSRRASKHHEVLHDAASAAAQTAWCSCSGRSSRRGRRPCDPHNQSIALRYARPWQLFRPNCTSIYQEEISIAPQCPRRSSFTCPSCSVR